jgi:hypothetical protein
VTYHLLQYMGGAAPSAFAAKLAARATGSSSSTTPRTRSGRTGGRFIPRLSRLARIAAKAARKRGQQAYSSDRRTRRRAIERRDKDFARTLYALLATARRRVLTAMEALGQHPDALSIPLPDTCGGIILIASRISNFAIMSNDRARPSS